MRFHPSGLFGGGMFPTIYTNRLWFWALFLQKTTKQRNNGANRRQERRTPCIYIYIYNCGASQGKHGVIFLCLCVSQNQKTQEASQKLGVSSNLTKQMS